LELWSWLYGFALKYGYFGAFLISIVGNVTVIFPVPYTITIYMLGAILDPFLLGVACGLGAAIGETSAYLVGAVGYELVEDKYGERIKAVARLLDRYGAPAIFVFAATPLPDDLLLVPLGMIRYNLAKALAVCFLGKLAMSLTLAYAGRYSWVFIKVIFTSGGGVWGAVAVAVLLGLIIAAIIKLDWVYLVHVVEAEGWGSLFTPEKIRVLLGWKAREGEEGSG